MDTLEIVAEVKFAINEFKMAAMDETGSHVDYSRLREEECCRRYCRMLIPKLRNLNLNALKHRDEAIAFWVNLYNTLVIHAVIEYGIESSIAKGGYHQLIRFFRRAAYSVGGFRFSPEDIEHGILRANQGNPFQFSPQYTSDDPRQAFVISPIDPCIHFALNCASRSCPPVGVYVSENLDVQLSLAASNFIQNEVEIKEDKLLLSQIFNWYKGDFGGKQGLVDILIHYLPENDRSSMLWEIGKKTAFDFSPYDWLLNI
jgi:hypothetical protein